MVGSDASVACSRNETIAEPQNKNKRVAMKNGKNSTEKRLRNRYRTRSYAQEALRCCCELLFCMYVCVCVCVCVREGMAKASTSLICRSTLLLLVFFLVE
jgi:hypothetical protein